MPLQGAADLPGGELALSPARQLEDPQGAQDPRMHREFVHVHLGEHGIQMHERPGAGDFKSQHRVDLGALVGEDGRCQLLDGLRLVCTNENDISAKEKIQSKSSRIQSKNEHTRRKKSFSCQKSKRKKTVISLGRIYVAFSSIKKCSISRGKSC